MEAKPVKLGYFKSQFSLSCVTETIYQLSIEKNVKNSFVFECVTESSTNIPTLQVPRVMWLFEQHANTSCPLLSQQPGEVGKWVKYVTRVAKEARQREYYLLAWHTLNNLY